MRYGKQVRYCPNCGKQFYDTSIEWKTGPMLCYPDCLKEWELKYARCILGKDETPPTLPVEAF